MLTDWRASKPVQQRSAQRLAGSLSSGDRVEAESPRQLASSGLSTRAEIHTQTAPEVYDGLCLRHQLSTAQCQCVRKESPKKEQLEKFLELTGLEADQIARVERSCNGGLG